MFLAEIVTETEDSFSIWIAWINSKTIKEIKVVYFYVVDDPDDNYSQGIFQKSINSGK